MANAVINSINIAGISTCVPKNVDKIADYKLIPENERDGFIKMVGVNQRRVADKGVVTSDLCYNAAINLMNKLGWDPLSVNALIFVTQSPDYLIPSTAIILQHRLGLSENCIAFDINLGCSGYVIGLQVASSLMNSSGISRAILLSGDVSTINLSYYDKSTYPLFGDAGSATALEYDENAQNMFFCTGSDGKNFDALYIKTGGTRHLATAESFEYKEFPGGIRRNDTQMILDGLRVFNFSITQVPAQINELLMLSSYSIESIDMFYLHQANRIMLETIRKKLKIPAEKCPYSLDLFGNTSSASIPLTICQSVANNDSLNPENAVVCGFGIGLSWASAKISLKNTMVLPITEYNECAK